MKKKNDNKNKENIDIKKLTILKRDIIDKTEINTLLQQKASLTLENYLLNYNKMKNFKKKNNGEFENLVN